MWLRVALVAIAALAGFSTFRFVTLSRSGGELEALRRENDRLRQANHSFESSLQQLQARLAEQESRASELAIVAGISQSSDSVDNAGAGNVGVGGSWDIEDLAPDATTLAARTEKLAEKLASIDTGLTERELRISSRPSLNPVRGILTSGYGKRADPMTGLEAFHRGIDISAPPGNDVFATADGIVTRAGRIGNFGRAVYIAHGFGYSTRYAHLSAVDVEPGDRVKRGQPIGKVGRTGRATGYHVHYEVLENGRSKDPLQHLLD